MKAWKATIKEVGREHLLHPEHWFTDDSPMSRDDIIDWWGLEQEDVEWYELELIDTENI